MHQSPRTRTTPTPRKGHLQHAPPGLPEDCWDEPVAFVLPTPQNDLEQLQGAWFCDSDRQQVEFLISGNRFAVRFARGPIYMGTFDLDPVGQPRRMTVHIDEGQPRHRGQTALCIYELTGDRLRWCTSGPGATDRLAEFPPEHDCRYLNLLFRRERAGD